MGHDHLTKLFTEAPHHDCTIGNAMTDNTDLSKQSPAVRPSSPAAPSGMGEAVAPCSPRAGAAGLVICGRNKAKGDAVAGSLTKAGCKTHYVEADLAKVEDCRKIIAAADKAFGNCTCSPIAPATPTAARSWIPRPAVRPHVRHQRAGALLPHAGRHQDHAARAYAGAT